MARKVIIDCDMGTDDAVALCIALFSSKSIFWRLRRAKVAFQPNRPTTICRRSSDRWIRQNFRGLDWRQRQRALRP